MVDYHRDCSRIVRNTQHRRWNVNGEIILWKWKTYKILKFKKPIASRLNWACESWIKNYNGWFWNVGNCREIARWNQQKRAKCIHENGIFIMDDDYTEQ